MYCQCPFGNSGFDLRKIPLICFDRNTMCFALADVDKCMSRSFQENVFEFPELSAPTVFEYCLGIVEEKTERYYRTY
jgi:hypothetical protein